MRYHLETFGCLMNTYDSEKLEGILAKSGMERADSPEDADVILLNTCSIREKAEAKVFSRLGRLAGLKKSGKVRLIALGGCMASLRKEEIFKRAPIVDVLFGPDSAAHLPQMLEDFRATGKRQVDVAIDEHTVWDGTEDLPDKRSGTVAASVGIMKGCDNHCTYCVVPSTRGPEVSRPAASILAEVRILVAAGYREVMLIGQNVNSYGKGLSPETGFPALLRMVEQVDGIGRIRFMTSHPKDMNDQLVEVMADSKKICPAIHLPLQAGADRILGMMNRNYTVDEYLGKVARLRKAIPEVAISTDIMAGFPTETESEFQRTLEIMEQVRFDSLYLFNYSPRPGTAAVEMEGMLLKEEAQSRFDRAHALHRRIVAEKLKSFVGSTQEVLCEQAKATDGGFARCTGRTPTNQLVIFKGDKGLVGKTLQVTIKDVLGYNLEGLLAGI